MPRITIKSPDDIRREVNAVKQQQKQQQQQQQGGGFEQRHSSYSSYYKRRALATDLTIDFGLQQLPALRSIQAKDLATLIEGATRLETLSLEHCEVLGDFDVVLKALSAGGTHLKNFSSYACRLRTSVADMIALGETLGGLPHLRGVSLGLSYMKHQPAWLVLKPVVENCKELNKIFVNGFYAPTPGQAESNQEVVQFFQACAASNSLQRLLCLPMLGRAFGDPTILQAVGAIIRNNQSLETLEIYILNGTKIIHLAEDLKYNSKLKRLALIGRHDNTTTTGRNGNSAEEEMDAFCNTLQNHNYTLQELAVEPWNLITRPPQPQNNNNNQGDVHEPTARQKLDFQLSLNRMGRKNLLRNHNNNHIGGGGGDGDGGDHAAAATTDEWLDAIANKDDISIIYYFLRKNPNLCDPKMWTNTTNATTNTAGYKDDNDGYMFSSSTAAAVVSPDYASTYSPPTSTTTNNNVGMVDSPLIPRVLLNQQQQQRRRNNNNNNKKRSRDEMEQDSAVAAASDANDVNAHNDDDADTALTTDAATTNPSSSSSSTILGVVTTTAYTAAVFAAGYWFRGASQHH